MALAGVVGELGLTAMSRACAVNLGVALLFSVLALAGAAFALAGPVTLVRMLGTIAMVTGALGASLQAYLLRSYCGRDWEDLAQRFGRKDGGATAALPA